MVDKKVILFALPNFAFLTLILPFSITIYLIGPIISIGLIIGSLILYFLPKLETMVSSEKQDQENEDK
ncbi:MAG: hypothetical protein ACTSRB_14915 [Candidatus Helarchaeota archaeon]